MLYLSRKHATRHQKEITMTITERKPDIALREGTKKALINGKRITLSTPPKVEDGKVYIPTDAIPKGCKAKTVTLDGVEYATAIDGMYIFRDTTGLILIDKDESVLSLNHADHGVYMMKTAAEMLFDIERLADPRAAYAPATEEERAVFKRIGEDAARRLAAHGRKHPYLFTSPEYAKAIRELYNSAEGTLRASLDKLVRYAEKDAGKDEYILNEKGDGLANPLPRIESEDGYDVGGRQYRSEAYASNAINIAFGYLATGKQEFAIKAFYLLEDLMRDVHWGPGHFLNCAGAAALSATAYDWLSDAWRELKLDTGAVVRGIYRLGVYEGWRSIIEDTCSYPSPKQGTGWRFKHKPDNWNAVCTGGLIVASLCLLSEEACTFLTDDEIEKTKEVLGACLAYISAGELVLMQYFPDGSYVESNSYWSYGTTALFRAISAVYDALGTDLGLSLSLGLDKTCYYAINSESPDFVGWNYHDGSLSGQDTSIFNMFATVSGDDALYALRSSHLERGKSPTAFEMLYHPVIRGRSIPRLSSLALDCYMEGIDAFVVRSGWESGSLYAGIMGGYNPTGGSHNQLDSGSFVYHNLGINWLCDMGSDYYNIKEGYFGNYHLYRRCAEGNNVLSLPSVEYGQGGNCTGYVVKHHSGKNAFAIIDNGEVYEDKIIAAKRGMLLTPDRKTLVIQDEVGFPTPTDAYAVAHFKSAEITAELDGGTCILTHKDGQQIKVTLLGDGELSVRDCYDFLLPTTKSFEGEYDRKEFSRLVVTHTACESIASALVIEPVDCNGYTVITPMDEWQAE